MTGEPEPSRESAADAFLARLNKTQLLIAAIAAQIVPLLVALKIDASAAIVIAAVIIVAAFALWRLSERRKAAEMERRRRDREWRERPLQAGFRGLSSYTRLDDLPGKSRQRLARRIAGSIAHPAFRYGLVSGEVGAGKSSLLDSGVGKELASTGFTIIFVRGLQDAADRALPAVLAAWRALLAQAENPVLILDQFEEMLIEWSTSALRQELGEFLNNPLPDKRTRVLCSVRADYIIAMYELAPALPDPTSSSTMNPVKNLDQEEAAEIIFECAAQDRMSIDRALADMIAADLAHGGQVRPPELQLVCMALQGDAPERAYRERGGAEGILSAHVKDVVDNSRDPVAARLILRALCNFEAMPPAKRQPQSRAQLAEAIGLPGYDGASSTKLELVLLHLVNAGLARELGERDDPDYALIHDYLVPSVARATSDASTEAERATQLLRLHLTEYSADDRTRIPLRRLRLIQRHAARELVATMPARALMRRSYWSAGRRAAAASSLVALLIVAIVSAPGLVPHWPDRTDPADAHHPRNYPDMVTYARSADGRFVLVTARMPTNSFYVSLWDVSTGRRLFRAPGRDADMTADGNTIAYIDVPGDAPRSQHGEAVIVRREPDGSFRKIRTGLTTRPNGIHFSPSGRALVVAVPGPSGPLGGAVIWDLAARRTVATLSQEELPPVLLDASGRVARIDRGLWRVGTPFPAGVIALVRTEDGAIASDLASRTIVTAEATSPNTGTISVWDFGTATTIASRTLSPFPEDVQLEYTADGEHVLLSNIGAGFQAVVLRLPDLVPVVRLPQDRRSFTTRHMGNGSEATVIGITRYFAWRNPTGGTSIWTPARGIVTSRRLSLDNIANTDVSANGEFLAITRKDGHVELWTTRDWRLVATPALPGYARTARFTREGNAILITQAGGSYSLLEMPSGQLVAAFPNLANVLVAYYDRECQRAHFWTREGFFYRYARGRTWPILGFRPVRDCQ
jgi:hypothetical protein